MKKLERCSIRKAWFQLKDFMSSFY